MLQAGSSARVDDLTLLLDSPSWILGRFDRLDLVNLTTVRRTIVFTIDVAKLREALMKRRTDAFPLALLSRGGIRTGLRLTDRSAAIVPFITQAESDERVKSALAARLSALGLESNPDLSDVLTHRPQHCAQLAYAEDHFDGYEKLAAENWGCPTVGRALWDLWRLQNVGDDRDRRVRLVEIARLLFDWQNSFVFFVRCNVTDPDKNLETLALSYVEELQQWRPPFERRHDALGRCDLSADDEALERKKIGDPPFREDLDVLAPWSPLLKGPRSCRALGRRGPLTLAWHVAWKQWIEPNSGSHVVEVTVPRELAVIRMRILDVRRSQHEGKTVCAERVVAAALTDGRMAAQADVPGCDDGQTLGSLRGVFVSVILAHRGRAGGLWGLWRRW